MIVYLIAVILVITGISLNSSMTPQRRKVFMWVVFLYVVVVFGLRFRVGLDTMGYMNVFPRVRDLSHFFTVKIFKERMEPGFLFIEAICKSIYNEFWFFQTVMCAITNGCIFLFLYRNCKNPFVGVLCYFIFQCFYFTTEIMRESAAVGVFLLNYKNCEDKKWLTYYLVSLISISFHYSAAITWFIPLARFLKPNFIFLFGCLSVVVMTPFIEKLGEIIPILSVANRIDTYINGSEKLTLNWRLGELIRLGFPALSVFLMYRFAKQQNRFQNLILLQILLCVGTFAVPVIFQRFTNYTSIFVIASMANVLCFKYAQSWIRILLIAFLISTQLFYYQNYYPRWIPYVSVLEQKYIPERETMYRDFCRHAY